MPRHFYLLALAAGLGGAIGAWERVPPGERLSTREVPKPPEIAARRAPGAPASIPSLPETRGAPVDPCTMRRAAVAAEPGLPGAPLLEARRAEILARARAEPVLFVRAPVARVSSPRAQRFRARLFSEASPWNALSDAYEALRKFPDELRETLLTDGYLYAEEPTLAALLVQTVVLSHLFRDPEIVVARGDRRRVAARRGPEYVWKDGVDAGQPARLWLFDRVMPSAHPPTEDHHVAFGELPRELGANEIEIEHITRRAVLARLHYYGGAVVPAVFAIESGRLELECESVGEGHLQAVLGARDRARRAGRVMAALTRIVEQQVSEGLPFDEPRTEDGQQDGHLRPEWRRAYLRGDTRYTFNDDRYFVFDGSGRPLVPQVCADFIVDSWERLSGTWWQARPASRGRQVGRLDFDELEIENRRRVEQLIEFARTKPDWFELLEIPVEARVPLRDRRRFFARLYEQRQDFGPGDVVAILGPRDDEQLHYHSFFVLARDPLTGMPTALGANAGRPRIRSWENEMQNAPRRSIVARIRPRLEWLEQLVGPGDIEATKPSG